MHKIINKIKYIMNSYNREIDKINNQIVVKNKHQQNTSNIEKYINDCNKSMDTNSIFY